MDRLDNYRQIITDLIEEYGRYSQADDVETEVLFDEKRDRYQLLAIGWQNKRRIHHAIIHIDIKQGKVWVQQDSTDAAIAEELVSRGIPRHEIVLGFQPAHRRQYTDFAPA